VEVSKCYGKTKWSILLSVYLEVLLQGKKQVTEEVKSILSTLKVTSFFFQWGAKEMKTNAFLSKWRILMYD